MFMDKLRERPGASSHGRVTLFDQSRVGDVGLSELKQVTRGFVELQAIEDSIAELSVQVLEAPWCFLRDIAGFETEGTTRHFPGIGGYIGLRGLGGVEGRGWESGGVSLEVGAGGT